MFKSLKQMFGGSHSIKQILAPVAGVTIPMSEVDDPTFSQELLGKGVAIIPSEGKVVAPADGEVVVMFGTKHAVSIRTDEGVELIIHIGLDTVNLKGQYYNAHVAQGDRVKAGDMLVEFDMDQIKAAGYDVVTPIIICNTPDYPNMVCHTGKEVQALEPVIDL